VIELHDRIAEWLLQRSDLRELYRGRLRQCGVTGEIELPQQLPEQLRQGRIPEVYEHLLNRRPADGPFIVPARFACELSYERHQEAAIYCLLAGAAHCARAPVRVVLRRDYDQAFAKLQSDFNVIRRSLIAHADPDWSERLVMAFRRVMKAEPKYIVLQRNRGMPEDIGVGVALSTWCFRWFNKPLYELSSALAAALEHTVSAKQIRRWWQEPPAEN
jgi:hypothetical protein